MDLLDVWKHLGVLRKTVMLRSPISPTTMATIDTRQLQTTTIAIDDEIALVISLTLAVLMIIMAILFVVFLKCQHRQVYQDVELGEVQQLEEEVLFEQPNQAVTEVRRSLRLQNRNF